MSVAALTKTLAVLFESVQELVQLADANVLHESFVGLFWADGAVCEKGQLTYLRVISRWQMKKLR